MWSVLLVEDEILVRESVKSIIPWEELGFYVVDEAGDGEEALQKIREHKPDLVITDIIMPMLNGVELLKAARHEGYASKFIVLSCMSDFEYVREAMEYGASNYILKLSMNVANLKEALEKVKDELFRTSIMDAQVMHHYFESLWNQIGENPALDVNATDNPIPIPQYRHLYFIVIGIMNGPQRVNQREWLQLDAFAAVKPQTVHTFTRWGQTSLFCGFTNPEDAERCVQSLQYAGEVPYPAAFSSPIQIEQLASGWESVLGKLDEYWYDGGSGIRHAQEGKRRSAEDFNTLWQAEREIIQRFEQMKADDCCQSADRLFDEWKQDRRSMYTVKETILRLAQTISRMTSSPSNFQERITECGTHEELHVWFVSYIREKMKDWQRDFPIVSDHPEVNRIIAYIRANYDQELTVKSLAKYVALDEKYVSGLFKKKTGESIIHFLQRVRIQRAEHYLRTTDLSVSEIGSLVGFSNDNYFIKIFRRFHQITPSQYRKSFYR